MYRRNPGRYAEKETRLFARKEKKVDRKPGVRQMPSAEPPACVETRTSFRANNRVSDIAINPGYACTFLTKAMNRWTAGNWYLPRI